MCIALAGGLDGCDNFPVGSKQGKWRERSWFHPKKKRWWYKVTKNPMVVVFFQIVYPQKPHILSEKMVTAVHPFVPCATKATSSLTANTAIVVWFMGFGDAGPRPHRTGRIGNKGRATSFVGNSRNPSLEMFPGVMYAGWFSLSFAWW